MSTPKQGFPGKLRTVALGLLALTMPALALAASPPIVNLNGSGPLSGLPPLTVTVNAVSSTCSSPCKAHFDFGDGATQDIYTGTPFGAAHTYTDGGNYTATVTLTDGNGLKASGSLKINITVGQSLSSYVGDCKQRLGFSDADVAAVADKLNCTKGVLFAPNYLGPQLNDYMGYARITDQVDLVFACRWLNNGTGINPNTDPPFVAAASIEMIMVNRQKGDTCFFEAKPRTMQVPGGTLNDVVPVAIVSPTVAAAAAPGTLEANFWYSPLALDNTLPCVDCHVAGPYISTPRIAPYLAQFGLLNNGHDTFGRYRDVDNNVVGRYHAVGTTLAHFDDLALNNNDTAVCSSSCHFIGDNSMAGDVFRGVNVLLPSIVDVFDYTGTHSPDISVYSSDVMPADRDDDVANNYRWINMDIPDDIGIPSSYAGEYETIAGLRQEFPQFYCSNPTTLQAHAVGSDYVFNSTDLPDQKVNFNLREGLTCLNANQGSGKKCNDYQTQYECTSSATGNKYWSGWFNKGSPANSDGDHEERSLDGAICASGYQATAIKARWNEGTTQFPLWTTVYGPNDHLNRFSTTGLVCLNKDQGSGQMCSNYVVRFNCDQITPPPIPTQVARYTNITVPRGVTGYVLSDAINGWTAWNAGVIIVNGVVVKPGQWPLAPAADGKYYFTFLNSFSTTTGWTYW